MKSRGGAEPTRVFSRPASGHGDRHRSGARAGTAARRGRGRRRGSTARNPFARPGLFLALVAGLFLLGVALGLVLGLRGH